MKLLFAEDDDLLRNSLTFYLKNNGYAVTSVSNGMEVKEQLKTDTFDLVITDLNMPFRRYGSYFICEKRITIIYTNHCIDFFWSRKS